MPNGNVTEYVRSNPEANRLRLVSPTTSPLRGCTLMPLDDP